MGDFKNVNLTKFLDDKFEDAYIGEAEEKEEATQRTEEEDYPDPSTA